MMDQRLQLIYDYFDNVELTAERQIELQELLRTDPQALAMFVEIGQLTQALSETLPGDLTSTEIHRLIDATATTEPAQQASAPSAFSRRFVKFFTQPTPLSLTIAALVVGLFVTALAFIVPPVYQSLVRNENPTEAPPEFVAVLTGTHGAEWGKWQVGTQIGAALNPSHRVDLEQGRIELTFRNGVVVIAQGPAKFKLESRQLVSLQRGKLLANVPPQAAGFTVVTESLRIVDLGTEFGVDIADDQSGEVHVLQGKVAVTPKSADATSQQRTVLVAGEGLKVKGNGRPTERVAGQPHRFALALPKPQTVAFQQGSPDPITGEVYEGNDDVMLIAWASDNNFGARPDFDIGQLRGQPAHALLRFNLTSLQGKVDQILSAQLVIRPNGDAAYYPWQGAGKIELDLVSEANANWQEGTHISGNESTTTGETTWNHILHPSTTWSGSRGASTAGKDFLAEPLALQWFLPETNSPLEFNIEGDLAFLQDWIDGEPNAGFLLRELSGDRENRINFHSSESANIQARPTLVIQYMPSEDADALKPETKDHSDS